MFTGIVETVGELNEKIADGTNLNFKFKSPLSHELSVDQSVSHNGVCLTVTKIDDGAHWVTAIAETLSKSNLGNLEIGSKVNLERCMPVNGRFDGHIVQGHVDTTAEVVDIQDQNGSWLYTLKLPSTDEIMVEKGSVCINGVSLTCFNIQPGFFDVAIIPYTYEHTNFHQFVKTTTVNIEFDIIGKYIKQLFIKSALK
ncbi:MAG: riboflavin synthase [Cyclobacteriaceae bacterium]|jgi:riboflavin synthase